MTISKPADEQEDDWGDLPEAAIEGIKAGLADLESGRVYTHEYVMDKINKKINHGINGTN